MKWSSSSSPKDDEGPSHPMITPESVYLYYKEQVLPALMATFPHLLIRWRQDAWELLSRIGQKLLPHFSAHDAMTPLETWLSSLETRMSESDLLNLTAILRRHEQSWWAWFSQSWPLMDFKVGVFLWSSCGGILLLLTLFSIVPGRLHGLSARILRWPVLGLVYLLIWTELCVYIVIRLAIRIAEALVARPKHRAWRRKMQNATSYTEWYQSAQALDQSQKRHLWLKQQDYNRRYNWGFVLELMQDMKAAMESGDAVQALAVLQQCTRKNVGGVMSEDLFSYSNTGEPKYIVTEFMNRVETTIRWVTEQTMLKQDNVASPDELREQAREEKNKLMKNLVDITLHWLDRNSHQPTPQISEHTSLAKEDLLKFFKRARAAYGRTALCLSGGAMMGCYHLGTIVGLLETGMLPHIISGTSAGSVIGAIVCTRTDAELRHALRPDVIAEKLTCFARPWRDRLKGLWNNGNMFDFDEWMKLIAWFTCGDLTFEEAYQKTGRVFCITLSSTTKKAPPVLLNHLTAPNVTIASAVVASAAVPGFIPPVRLQHKIKGKISTKISDSDETYFDGSITQDIPVNGLAEMLNCQFFVVCQCNPHIVPFFFGPKGTVGRPSRWSSGTQESSWRGGFLLAALEMYLKTDMKAKLRFLDDVEAAVGFTSTLLTQEFVGSTTIVPQVSFQDYFKLFEDPSLDDLYRYYQAGAVAAYEHVAMIKLHYSIADAFEECIAVLEGNEVPRFRKRLQFVVERRKPRLVEPNEDGDPPPSILNLVMRRNSFEQNSEDSPISDHDEYSRDWVDLY